MLHDPRNQGQTPNIDKTNNAYWEKAEQVLKQALDLKGLSFQKSVWLIATDSAASISRAIETYLEQSNIQFNKLLNVSESEYPRIENGSIGITADGHAALKPAEQSKPVAWATVFEFTNTESSNHRNSIKQLTLLQFWRKMSQAPWLVEAMKAGLPNLKPIILVSFLINLLALAPAIFSIQVYDRIIPNQAFASLWALGTGVLICLGFELLLKKSRHQLLEHAATVTDTLCTKKLSTALLNTETTSTKPSVLLQHLRSFESLREVITGVFLLTVVDVPFLLIFLAVIGLVHPYFLILSILVITISLFHIALTQRKLSRLGQEQMKQARDSHNRWIETLGCLPTLQSLGIHQLWSKRLTNQQIQQRLTANEIREHVFSSSQFTQALQQIGWVSIIALGAWLASINELTVGGMIAASMLTMRCFAPIQKLQAQLMLSHVAQSGFVELDEYISRTEEKVEPRDSLENIQNIQLNQVQVNLGEQHAILENISMQIKAGDRIGLIGPNSSGKTTLLNLLAGVIQPVEGGYCINNLDTQRIGRSELGKLIGFAEQPPQLIEGTLLDNIRMNRPWVSVQDCVSAIEQLGLTPWIAGLSDGLHHKVHVGGKNLSSGKRQMISLARALSGRPELLLLDEPTVCLDRESEAQVRNALQTLPSNVTLVLATHSLSLLEATDRLILLEKGKIKAHGERAVVLQNAKRNTSAT